MSFTSVADASTYFQNHVLDLGAETAVNHGQGYDLKLTLTETFAASGSGFYANMLVGDAAHSAQSTSAIHLSSWTTVNTVASGGSSTSTTNSNLSGRRAPV